MIFALWCAIAVLLGMNIGIVCWIGSTQDWCDRTHALVENLRKAVKLLGERRAHHD